MASQSTLNPQLAIRGQKPAPTDFSGIWSSAQQRYQDETGHELPSAGDFPSMPRDPDEVLRYIDHQGQGFETFRTQGEKIRRPLKALADIVLLVLDTGAEGAASVAPGGKAVFVAIGVLLKATKGITELYDVIETLLEKFNGCFERIKIHLAPSMPPAPLLMKIFVDMLVQVLTTLAIVTKHCLAIEIERQPRKRARIALTQRAKDYVREIMGKKDVQSTLRKFEELTDAELLATAVQSNAVARENHPRMKLVYDETVVNALRSWLRAPDPQPIDYEKKRQTGSCQWFFDDQFENWKLRRDGMYWVYGRAGTGKSVLCSSVIDMLDNDPTLLLAYFYFDHKDIEKQDCRGLISSLVFQIGSSFQAGIDYLREQRRSPNIPVYEKLLDMLARLLHLSGRTFIVIDALDECPEPARDSKLLDFVEYLSSVQSEEDVELRVLVASRPESDILVHMPGLATQTLDFNTAKQHMDEISDYISAQFRIRKTTAYLGWSDEMKRYIRCALMEKSNGIFLWVKLQLQILKRCTTLDDVKCAVRELPTGLRETYERILNNFEASTAAIDRVRHVFECIAFATRLLSPAEVVEVLFMQFPSSVAEPIPLNSKLEVDGVDLFVIQKCPSLLEVVSDKEGHKTVQFIHLSVKEYLTSEKLLRSAAPTCLYGFRVDDANITLARICLSTLIAHDSFSSFREYADEWWIEHVSCGMDNAIGDLLYCFLHPGSASFAAWATTTSFGGEALHYVASRGLCHHMKRILVSPQSSSAAPQGSIARVRDAGGDTALHIAAKHGFANVAHVLLNHGALVDDVNIRGQLPLHTAAFYGKSNIVRLLLNHVPDGFSTASFQCSIRDNGGRTALHSAAMYPDNVEICEILLDYGAPVDVTDNNGQTPLHAAASGGNPRAVRLLLEHPAEGGHDVSILRSRTRDNNGWTALHWAAKNRGSDNVSVCRILLESGALIDAINTDGDIALHIALRDGGGEEIARFLLEYPTLEGSNVSATLLCRIRNRRGETALHCTAKRGCRNICGLLLECGADIGEGNNDGDTALHVAARQRHYTVVDTLLRHPTADGADVARLRCMTRNHRAETVFHVATGSDHWDVADSICYELFNCGLLPGDMDAKDDNGDTVLHRASATGRINTIKLILTQSSALEGDDTASFRCRARNKSGRTALHEAASRGRVEICRILLQYGALVDDADNDASTPLSLAEARYRDRAGHDTGVEMGGIHDADDVTCDTDKNFARDWKRGTYPHEEWKGLEADLELVRMLRRAGREQQMAGNNSEAWVQ